MLKLCLMSFTTKVLYLTTDASYGMFLLYFWELQEILTFCWDKSLDYYYVLLINQGYVILFQISTYTTETYNGLKVGLTRASFQHTTVACASIWLGEIITYECKWCWSWWLWWGWSWALWVVLIELLCAHCVCFFLLPFSPSFFTQWHTLRHYSSRQQKNNKMNMLLMPRIVFAGRSHLVLLLFVRFFTNVVATATEASNTMVVMHQY